MLQKKISDENLTNITSARIPLKTTCYRLMAEMAMIEHIAAHSIQVYLVAQKLTDLFLCRGIDLNRDLIGAGALLHDITKTRSLETGENHAVTGSELILSLGYPEVSRIVARHGRLDEWTPSEAPREEEIVNYADKRVIHTRVGSLEERLGYILERYGTDPVRREIIRSMFKQSARLEKRLFKVLDCSPGDLTNMVVPVNQAPEFEDYLKCASARGRREHISTRKV
ncbi:MAG: HD domain-containing protein [Syntrophales bacterium]|nr:HD domain-containing protein [Syntrophales bacterium]